MAKIDKNAVIAVLCRRHDEARKRRAEQGRDADLGEVKTLRDAAMELPEEEPGRWIEEPHCFFRCSKCGMHISSIRGFAYNYCPYCGVPMEKEEACVY